MIKTKPKKMKQVFFTTMAFIALSSCTTDNGNDIIIKECCATDSTTVDSTTADQVDYHPTDSTGAAEFPLDSIKNVGELLDQLESIPSTHR